MQPIRVAQANINKRLRGQRLARAIEAATAGRHVVAVQEAESDAHVHALANVHGLDAYFPDGAVHGRTVANACPILYDAQRFRRLDAGSVIVGEGIAHVQPDRPATWVLLQDRASGTKVAVISAHTVSGVWRNLARTFARWAGRTRRQESEHELSRLAMLTRRLAARVGPPGIVIGGGDLNRRAKLDADVLGADRVVYAPHPTHGRSWYDVIWLVGATAGHVRAIGSPSDHDVLAATVTPTSSSKPPTRKQEEPVSVAPPSPPFIAARHHGGHQTPRAIVMHGTVSPCDRGRARSIAAWWHGSGSPVTSAHYIVDPYQIVQCVGDHTVAYHCGYNDGSIGIELCDPETGPADRWHDHAHDLMLDRAADLVARLCLAYDIAPAHVSVASLKAHGPHGIYSHDQSRRAFGHTTHTDPRGFPWPDFMRRVHAAIDTLRGDPAARTAPEEDEVTPQDIEKIAEAVWNHKLRNVDANGDEQGHMKAGTFLTNIEWNFDRADREQQGLLGKILAAVTGKKG